MFSSSTLRSFVNNKQKRKSAATAALIFFLLVAMAALMVNESKKSTITFTANGETGLVQTHAKTVSAFLEEQNVELGEHDYIFPSGNQSIQGDMQIEWAQAEQYAIALEDKKIIAWATSSKVKDILEKADVTLARHERVTPGLSEEAESHVPITIESMEETNKDETVIRYESASSQ